MDNSKIHIVGTRNIELVPYTKQYVETYHGWMCQEDLLELTCSEPLTLEEEYRNQEEWLESDDKLTFIIVADGAPIGDCNIFLEDGTAEVEVMIASTAHRQKGYATLAITYLMQYAAVVVKVMSFRAKILTKNTPSLSLFKSLGFTLEKSVLVFEEEHYVLPLPAARSLFESNPCMINGV